MRGQVASGLDAWHGLGPLLVLSGCSELPRGFIGMLRKQIPSVGFPPSWPMRQTPSPDRRKLSVLSELLHLPRRTSIGFSPPTKLNRL
ncbi:MAG: hypothetical protein JWS10_2073 [Cypionkella sp.]|nr:hypothetical protein [Cypionkella sp.]